MIYVLILITMSGSSEIGRHYALQDCENAMSTAFRTSVPSRSSTSVPWEMTCIPVRQ